MSFTDANESQPVRTEANGDVAAKIVDATTPSQGMAVDVDGNITANQGKKVAIADAWPVAGTDGTNSQAYLATGEAKVAVTQPIAAGTNIIGKVEPTDGTNSQAYLSTGEAKVSVTQPLPAGTAIIGKVELTDGTNTAAVLATGEQKVAVTQPLPAGTNIIGEVKADLQVASAPVTSSNPVPVYLQEAPGTEVISYDQGSATAAGSASNHIYTVTALKTLRLKNINVSSSGKGRFEIQVAQDGSTYVTVGVLRVTASSMNDTFGFDEPMDVAAGGKVKVIKTNQDKSAEDLDSTIIGLEV